jgi:hypothetical protein
MFNASGKPRYWLEDHDRWNLLIPVVFIGLLVAWLLVPPPPKPAMPAAPPPLTPTIIRAPVSGTRFAAGQIGAVEGTAHPGSRVQLSYRTMATPERWLAEALVGADGRFRFGLAGFPPGSYGLRVSAVMPDGRRENSFEVLMIVDPAPKAAPPKSAARPPAKKVPRR